MTPCGRCGSRARCDDCALDLEVGSELEVRTRPEQLEDAWWDGAVLDREADE